MSAPKPSVASVFAGASSTSAVASATTAAASASHDHGHSHSHDHGHSHDDDEHGHGAGDSDDDHPAAGSSSDSEEAEDEAENEKDKLPDDSVLDVQEGEEVELADKGGIIKKLIKKGEGGRPPKGAEVKVHYVGTLLDGTKFDSSRDRGELFAFKLGRGQVIKGWDRGVASMRKGEVALLTCQPEYAYGKAGSPPKIPPDATLRFEVEVVEWSNRQNVTEDGLVAKEIVVEGKGYTRPNDDATVTVKYVGRVGTDHTGRVFDDKHQDAPVTLNLGEELYLVPGFVAAVKNMYQGERSRFWVKPKMAFGAEGNSELKVGPGSPLFYEIEMVDFHKGKESWEMDMEQKLAYAHKKKEQANTLFKAGRLADAASRYQKALDLFRYENSLPDEQKQRVRELKVSLNNNIGATRLKQRDFPATLKSSNDVLAIDPHNNKAKLRRARVYAEQHDDELAAQDLHDVIGHADTPASAAEAEKLLAVVKKRMAAAKQKERDLFKDMFAKIKLTDEAAAKAAAEQSGASGDSTK